MTEIGDRRSWQFTVYGIDCGLLKTLSANEFLRKMFVGIVCLVFTTIGEDRCVGNVEPQDQPGEKVRGKRRAIHSCGTALFLRLARS